MVMSIMYYQAVKQGEKMRKGPWHGEEDERLAKFVAIFGEQKWDSLAEVSGLRRSGKSCRLRWLNYLRPNLKHGHITAEEEQIIIQFHERWGNKWARIARKLPGRTDNEIKNYWRTRLRKKMEAKEKGNFQCNTDQKGNTSARICNIEDSNSVQDNRETNGTFLEDNQLSSFTILDSPYVNRLYDWMSELSGDDQAGEMKIHDDCDGLGSCSRHLAWNSEDSDTSILDSLGSLWDI